MYSGEMIQNRTRHRSAENMVGNARPQVDVNLGVPESLHPDLARSNSNGYTKNRKQPRHSVPAIILSPPIEASEDVPVFTPTKLPDRHLPKQKSLPDQDLSDLPGLDEEELDGGEFRQRSGSAGIRSLIKFRSRNKSGEKQTTHETLPDDKKGFKSFLDAFRPRSKSDASSLMKQAAMSRRKHASGGQGIQQVLTDVNQQNLLGGGDLEPMQRQRSTSLGAKDKLRLMKEMRVSGGANAGKGTLMGQLISNGVNSQHSNVLNNSEKADSRSGSMEHIHRPTGRALIWEDNDQPNTGDPDKSFMDGMQIEDIEENDPLVFNKFMRAHKCYDIIPNSSKLIVFDTSLSVKKAFYALVYNCVRSAPLWDQKKQQFVGMLTITDFIMILHKYYKSPKDAIKHEVYEQKMTELEEHQISSWRRELSSHYKPFVSITPEDSVRLAVRKLTQTKVHRLPVIDPKTGNAIYVITHKRILKFMHIFMKSLPKPDFMAQSIESLRLGTYSKLVYVNMDTKLIDALALFVSRRVSALPVVDEDNIVMDIYAKFDVINLAADKSYGDLDVTIEEVISSRNTKTEHVLTCLRTDSLAKVIEKIVNAGVHRLVVTSPTKELEGIISLSDILSFLLQDELYLSSASDTSCSAAMATAEKHTENKTPKTIQASG